MPVKVLFLCVHNACRSQMAEGFARAWGGGVLEPHSAGSAPSGVVDPGAIETMREAGIDISAHRSKPIRDVPLPVDFVVRMGCGDTCPVAPSRETLDWDLPDPGGFAPHEVRAVRDEIGRRVQALIDRCGGDRARWNAKYREGRFLPHPSAVLPRWVYRFKKGRALDLACGTGPAASFLHELGWRVVGVDGSDVGLSLARREHPEIPLVKADLRRFHARPGSVDTIVSTYFLDRSLVPRWLTWLTSGGTLYLETFTTGELKYKPAFRRDFLLERGEVQDLAGDAEVLHVDEVDDGEKAYAVLILRR